MVAVLVVTSLYFCQITGLWTSFRTYLISDFCQTTVFALKKSDGTGWEVVEIGQVWVYSSSITDEPIREALTLVIPRFISRLIAVSWADVVSPIRF